MFLGRFDHTVDPKGRISIPARFRDKLLGDPRLILAPHYMKGEPSVDVHPQAAFEKLLEQRETGDQFDEAAIDFQVGYLAESHEVEIDAAGRILVPPSLRQHARLAKDVAVLGVGSKFILMDRERWEKVKGEHIAEASVNRAPYKSPGR